MRNIEIVGELVMYEELERSRDYVVVEKHDTFDGLIDDFGEDHLVSKLLYLVRELYADNANLEERVKELDHPEPDNCECCGMADKMCPHCGVCARCVTDVIEEYKKGRDAMLNKMSRLTEEVQRGFANEETCGALTRRVEQLEEELAKYKRQGFVTSVIDTYFK
jgi:hypothetical protein